MPYNSESTTAVDTRFPWAGLLLILLSLALAISQYRSLGLQKEVASLKNTKQPELDSPEKIKVAISKIAERATGRTEPEMRDAFAVLTTLDRALRMGEDRPHRLYEAVVPISAEMLLKETKPSYKPPVKK